MVYRFPRRLYAEMFLGTNGWTSVATDVRQTSPITITRGRGNEQSKVAPSKLTAVLTNTGGKYTIDNPTSPYHGILGPNTPFRCGLVVAEDTFTRVVVDGMGTSDSGDVWTMHPAVVADFDVTGSVFTQLVPTTNTVRRSYLAGLTGLGGYEVIVDILNLATPAGSHNAQGIMLRGQSTANYVAVDCQAFSTGEVKIAIRDTDDNTYLYPPTTVAGVSGGNYRLHAMVEGNTIYGKLYNLGSPEPLDWHASAVSTLIAKTGWPGIRAWTGSGNSNITFTYDNLTVRLPRAHGEVVDTRPRSDESHKIKTAELEVAGILRRLQQGDTPEISTLRRGYLSLAVPPIAYWPMEEGKEAVLFSSQVGTASDLIARSGRPKSASNTDFPCSAPIPVLNGVCLESRFADYDGSSGIIQTRFLLSVPTNGDTNGAGITRLRTTGSAGYWDLIYSTASGGSIQINAYDQSGTTILTTGDFISGFNDVPRQIFFNLTQNGANIDYELGVVHIPVDMNSTAFFSSSATLTNQTLGRASLMRVGAIQPGAIALINTAVGHVSMHKEITAPTNLINELGAFIGERAVDRFFRLCQQNSIVSAYLGTPSLAAKMGPQRVRKLIDLLTECSAAEMGDMYEARGSGGLVIRTLETLLNQGPMAAIDYAAEQVAPLLRRSTDDQGRVNDVTVKQPHGSSYRAVQTTGPLNVSNPGTAPDGVGTYDTSVDANVHTPAQLVDQAHWRKHLGTVKEPRFPNVRVQLAAPEVVADDALFVGVMAADVADRLTIDGMVAADVYDPVTQLALGYTEVLHDQTLHEIAFNTAPESPYHVGVWDDTDFRWDTDDAELHTAVDGDDTELSVALTGPFALDHLGITRQFLGPYWTTDAAEFPLPVNVGGERISVTDIDDELFTFVAAGSAAHADNASVAPGLPAGIAEGDLLLCLAAIRGTGAGPTGTNQGYFFTGFVSDPNVRLFAKLATASETAPTVSFGGGAAGDDTSAQVAAFRGKFHDVRNLFVNQASYLNGNAAQNIDYPGLWVPFPNCLIIHHWWKQDDNTGVTGAVGTEIGDLSTTLGNDQSLGWSYQIQTAATDIAPGTLTVAGGAAAISRGTLLALRADRQRFTVSRSANGVVKSHAVGAKARLADPFYWGPK